MVEVEVEVEVEVGVSLEVVVAVRSLGAGVDPGEVAGVLLAVAL